MLKGLIKILTIKNVRQTLISEDVKSSDVTIIKNGEVKGIVTISETYKNLGLVEGGDNDYSTLLKSPEIREGLNLSGQVRLEDVNVPIKIMTKKSTKGKAKDFRDRTLKVVLYTKMRQKKELQQL